MDSELCPLIMLAYWLASSADTEKPSLRKMSDACLLNMSCPGYIPAEALSFRVLDSPAPPGNDLGRFNLGVGKI